jgi:hypothetical protein
MEVCGDDRYQLLDAPSVCNPQMVPGQKAEEIQALAPFLLQLFVMWMGDQG